MQTRTKDSKKLYENFANEITFNNDKEMITNLKNLINNSNLSRINNFFLQKFNDEKI